MAYPYPSEQNNLSFHFWYHIQGLNFPSFYLKGDMLVAINKYKRHLWEHLSNVKKKKRFLLQILLFLILQTAVTLYQYL